LNVDDKYLFETSPDTDLTENTNFSPEKRENAAVFTVVSNQQRVFRKQALNEVSEV
jgi:hypothetical protein